MLQIINYLDLSGFQKNMDVFIVTSGYLVSFVLLLPTLSVTCRRLHDIGKSGWWQLHMGVAIACSWGLFFAGVIGLIIVEIFADTPVFYILLWALILVAITLSAGISMRWITWLARDSDDLPINMGRSFIFTGLTLL